MSVLGGVLMDAQRYLKNRKKRGREGKRSLERQFPVISGRKGGNGPSEEK